MVYNLVSSTYLTPTKKPYRQPSTFSLKPPNSISAYRQDLKVRQSLPNFRPPPHNPSKKLVSLISKFEALGATKTMPDLKPPASEISSCRPSARLTMMAATSIECPPRNLSNIFSPRPPSQGRYENVFPEDESPVERDDVFTCPPYNAIGAIEKLELARLKRTSSIITNLSISVSEGSRKPNILVEVEDRTVRGKAVAKDTKLRSQSIKDRIKFFGGGLDNISQAMIVHPNRKVNMDVSISSQIPTNTTTPTIPLKQADYLSAVKTLAKLIPGANNDTSSTPATKSNLQHQPGEQDTELQHLSPIAVRTPKSTPKSLGSKAATPSLGRNTRAPGSAHDSPLRDRRLTRCNIPRRTQTSRPPSVNMLPRSAEKITSAVKGPNQSPRLNTPRLQRENGPRPENQIHEKIGELYRAKSQQQTALDFPTAVKRVNDSRKPTFVPIAVPRSTQLDGPISRRPSTIAELRALFDGRKSITPPATVSRPSSQLSAAIKLNATKSKDSSSNLVDSENPIPRVDTTLSMILERTENSFSENSMELERRAPVPREDPAVGNKNHRSDTPVSSIKNHSSSILTIRSQQKSATSPTVELESWKAGIKSNENVIELLDKVQPPEPRGQSSPPPCLAGIQPISPIAIEAETLSIDALKHHVTDRVSTFTIGHASDRDDTRTTSFGSASSQLHVPKKRQATRISIDTQSARTPFTAALLSPVQEVQPLRIPKKRQSLIPQASLSTKISPEKLPLPISPHRNLAKSQGLENRIKLFDRSPEVRTVSNLEKVLKDGPFLRSRRKMVAGVRLKKSKDSVKANESFRRELSLETINAIVTGFQDMTAAAKDAGERQMQNDGDVSMLSDMIIKEVNCEMASPRPVRLVEIDRMVVLCRGKGERTKIPK